MNQSCVGAIDIGAINPTTTRIAKDENHFPG